MKIKKLFFKRLASVLSVFLILMPFANLSLQTASASSQTTFTSQSDFEAGNLNDNLDSTTSPGQIKLKNNLNTYTESTSDDFGNGTLSDTAIENQGGGDINLSHSNASAAYNSSSDPSITSNSINYSYLDPSTNLLYICTSDAGLEVVDTKGNTTISDNTSIGSYSTGSTPASIAGLSVKHVFLDSANNLLYVSTSSGLSVIKTKGTATLADDELLATYSTSSSPSDTPNIASSDINNVTFDSTDHLLFISTSGGLSIVNTQGTVNDTTDDILVGTYSATSSPDGTPSLPSSDVRYSFYQNGRIYICVYGTLWNAGFVVINTNGTPYNLTDDTFESIFQYDAMAKADPSTNQKSFLADLFKNLTNNFVAIANAQGPSYSPSSVSHAFIYEKNGDAYLYFSTYGYGLKIIDTKGTDDTNDDTDVGAYSTYSTPALPSDEVKNAYMDSGNNLLYITTNLGVTIINTHGTLDPSDDTLESNIMGQEGSGTINSSFLDLENNTLYLSTSNDGLELTWSDTLYNPSGTYTSQAIDLANGYNSISWDETKNSNQNVSLKTKTAIEAGGEQLWADEFNDNDHSNVTDSYGLGWAFNDVGESDGVLTMTNPGHAEAATMFIDSGTSENSFPTGSKITVRMRFVGSGATNVSGYLSTDNYETDSPDGTSLNNGEWQNVTLNAAAPFSVIELDNYWDNDTWNSTTDKIEIDWAKVEAPDDYLSWGDWSSPCSDHTGCTIEDIAGKASVQYRFNLATSDTSSTPSVNSVTLSGGYQTTGDYVSSVIYGGDTTHWETLTADHTVPDVTSIVYYTRTGNTPSPDGTWSDWQAVNSPIASPDGQYLQYKATLSTSSAQYTPTLSSVTITYTPQSLSQNDENANNNVNDNSDQQNDQSQISYHAPVVIAGNSRPSTLTEDSVTSVNGLNVIFKGGFDALAKGTVRIYKDGKLYKKAVVNKAGKWRASVHPRRNIVSAYQFKYFDSNGQLLETTPAYQLIVDKLKPVISLLKSISSSNGGIINWQVRDNDSVDHCTCSFRGKNYPVSDNTFTVPNTAPSGKSKLKVTCFDRAQNNSSKGSNIIVE